MSKGRITGIGGIFFKCPDPTKTKEWYKQNLGLKTDQWGASFEFRLADRPGVRAYAQWSTFPANTKYFDPSSNEFMVNYRVENLVAYVKELKEKGVTICDEIETFDYGKFVHILDGDGRKIELWEPVHGAFDESNPEGSTNM
ncbi:MAG: VOC family protein [Saprospiraceae bacterium]|nr:VOC family protein [Saprospiraceae bacterium]